MRATIFCVDGPSDAADDFMNTSNDGVLKISVETMFQAAVKAKIDGSDRSFAAAFLARFVEDDYLLLAFRMSMIVLIVPSLAGAL